MQNIRLIPIVASAALLILLAGCDGGPKYVPVSGVVTLDGKPYTNAIVSLQPIGTPQNPAPGRGSSALTDANGHFTLMTDDGHPGAVVGKHRVRIQTKREDPTAFVDPSVGSPDDVGPLGRKVEIDPIPLEWYSDRSTKEFEVPPGGTDQANFDIVRTKKK